MLTPYRAARAARSIPSNIDAGPYSTVSKVTTPSTFDRRLTNPRAIALGRYPSSSTARNTRSRVSGRTRGLSLSTRDTV
ncbi:hypothetical protein JMUB6875_46100 [Nocardia sp. JMUB6875]